jgi:hypothetical protein
MDYLPSSILKKILERGYQIHPEALKVLEARGEENALVVLESFSEKYSEAIVIEATQVEELLEKTTVKTTSETKEFGSKRSKLSTLNGSITQIYDGSGLIQRCPKCNRWIERIRDALFGKNFEIEGVKLNGGNFLVKDIREV